MRQIEYYASIMEPYDKLSENQKLKISNDLDDWKTPNQSLIYKICFFHVFFKLNFQSYNQDCKKFWILKPSDKSKGCGIQIIDNDQKMKYILKNKDRVV